MSVHHLRSPLAARGRARVAAPAPTDQSADIDVREATTLDDFMQATPLLRQLARETMAPMPPHRIGRTLARFSFGGSGRDTGTLVLARIDGRIVGFAVLQPTPRGIELTWLHVGATPHEAVVQALWDHVSRIAIAWTVGPVHVGYFVSLPASASQSIAG